MFRPGLPVRGCYHDQLTWIFNRTRSSVLVALAFHVVFNTLNVALLPVISSVPAFALLTAIEWVAAVSMLGSLGTPQPREAVD